jgi:fructose-1,6-bisphosphatase I
MYECNPLAFIIEQAGGKASDGKRRILDIQPSELHERTPIFIGNTSMVEKLEEFIRQAEASQVDESKIISYFN